VAVVPASSRARARSRGQRRPRRARASNPVSLRGAANEVSTSAIALSPPRGAAWAGRGADIRSLRDRDSSSPAPARHDNVVAHPASTRNVDSRATGDATTTSMTPGRHPPCRHPEPADCSATSAPVLHRRKTSKRRRTRRRIPQSLRQHTGQRRSAALTPTRAARFRDQDGSAG